MNWKRIGILGFGLSGVLVLAVALTLVVGGIALAQTPTPVPSTPGKTGPGGGRGFDFGGLWGGGRFGGGFGFGMGGDCGFGMKGWGGDVNIMNVVAKTLGMDQAALQTELQNGKTIAQLATEKNVATDKIVNDIVAAYKTSLDLAVTNGYLTQTQADAILEAVRAFAPTYLDRSFVSNNPMTVIAKALGMTETEMMTALRGGKTITQLAQEKGVSTDTIVNALVAAEKAQLDKAVADGRLTQAQADALLKVARVMAPSYLEGTGKFGGKFGPGMMGGRGGHGMGRGGDWGAPGTAPKTQ